MNSRDIIIVLVIGTLVAVAIISGVLLIINRSDEPAQLDPSFAGRYRMQPPNYYQGGTAPPSDVAYYLYLDGQGTARFEEERLDTGQVTVIAQGTWEWDG
ncbi:MAG: hypothetical protein ACK2US_17345, partial [Anaerolineae bacterium]